MVMSVGAFAGILVIGVLLMIIGGIGLAFTDPFSDPAIWFALILLGVVMFIGGIVYVVALQARAPLRS